MATIELRDATYSPDKSDRVGFAADRPPYRDRLTLGGLNVLLTREQSQGLMREMCSAFPEAIAEEIGKCMDVAQWEAPR